MYGIEIATPGEIVRRLRWITAAVAQKIGAVETADAILKRRAATARSGDLTRYLDRAPDAPPVPGDELPDGAGL